MNDTSLTFLASLKIQLRVISALLMREVITRYGRHNIGFMWLFLEPMLFTLGIAGMWSILKMSHGGQVSIIAFALTGYSSVLVWRNTAGRCSKAIEPNLSLLYHRNVRVLDVFFARALLEIAGATISLVLLIIFFIIVGLIEPPNDLLKMLIAWFLLSWFSLSLGLVIGSISEMSDILDRIWHTITYLMFPLSGAVFMVDWLHGSLKEVVLWLPMVHGLEMLRHGYFGDAIPTYESPLFLVIANSILMLIGLMLAKRTSNRVEPQ